MGQIGDIARRQKNYPEIILPHSYVLNFKWFQLQCMQVYVRILYNIFKQLSVRSNIKIVILLEENEGILSERL